MCGIFAFIKTGPNVYNFNFYDDYLLNPFQEIHIDYVEQNIEIDVADVNLSKRGPDAQHTIETENAFLYHSLLHMRGNQLTIQPIQIGQYILQYNGELYGIPNESDTQYLIENIIQNIDNLQPFLDSLHGDYSFILHDLVKKRIIIAKDPFGKKSLLLAHHKDGFILTSQPIGQQKIEVQEDEEEDDGKTVDEKYLLRKYMNEFTQIKDKRYLELPANAIYTIQLGAQTIWTKQQIHQFKLEFINEIQDLHHQIYQSLYKSVFEIISNIQGEITILFSGGIDCSFIAFLVGIILPKGSTIHLVNVAFAPDAADRETSLIAHQELSQRLPDQKFNLILVDCSIDQLEEKTLLDVIYPKVTHMDFNIAMVLRLASMHAPTRVVLSGLGADEIFCGYARYRHALKRGDVLSEMNFDIKRLWVRNLGRDDRAVSEQSKELRFPYLDVRIVEAVRNHTNLQYYVDKQLLREIVANQGLLKIAGHKKRAIQFGTKLAKLSNKKHFGGNKHAKGNKNYN